VAKYGNFVYGGAKYGVAPKLAYSVEPMSITVIDFTRVELTWQSPTGAFTKIKLVRNQFGFPETSEDGLTIWEENATEGTVTRGSFVDGEDNLEQTPIVNGRQVYYTMFLFTDQKVWVKAGEIADLMPLDHGVHKRIMDIIPKVFTSDIQSPLGVTDETSHLYKFMGGIAFTHDQFLSQLDVLRPQHSSEGVAFSTLSQNSFSLGLVPEPAIPVKNQKRLIREALYMYSHKGTELGINAYAESLTGFAPTTTLSTNLLLSVQDSTFYNSIGNWTATNATLTSSNEQVPATGTNVIDNVYTGKVIASSSGAMSLGNTAPITRGVPILPDTECVVSCKLKSPSSAGSITLSAKFYDRHGEITGTTQSATAVAANNTWKSSSKTFTTPSDASYASLEIAYSAAGTYYIDQVCLQLGDTVAYDEARAISVFLDSAKVNYIKNPSFEVNVTDSWTLDGAAVATREADVSAETFTGDYSVKITATDDWTYTSNTFPIETGIYYTASGLAKTTADLTLSFVGRDAEGDIVEDIDIYPLGTLNDWSHFSATDLTDGLNLTVVTYEVIFSGGAGDFYLDSLMFEKNHKASEYFDGSLPSEYGAVWEGTEHNSFTHMYPNKPLKIPRLGKTLNDWIVPNTFWRLSTYDGVEYTNLTV
jgi:hypothetical protein